jgi:hypothetical protein
VLVITAREDIEIANQVRRLVAGQPVTPERWP